VLRFGAFELDPAAVELRSEGGSVPLGGKPMVLLELLVGRPGRVVEREDIRRCLWGDGVHVDFDQGINAAVRQLRQALGDDAANPRYLATVPRRGYRFVAPVEVSEGAPRQVARVAPSGGSIRERGRSLRIASGAVLGAGVVLAVLAALVGGSQPAAGDPSHLPRLAVLPFEAAGEDGASDTAWLGDGLTAELISVLDRQSGSRLDVIADTSASRLRGVGDPGASAARRLSADHVLTGGVWRSGERIRVSARLVRASDRATLWAGSYDRRLEDILAVEREVAERIATALELELDRGGGWPASPTLDARGYEDYLRGRRLLDVPGGDRGEAMRLLTTAVTLEPGYAPAWVELARAWRLTSSPNASRAPAGRALEHALSLDDSSSQAHLLLGTIHLYGDLDPVAAGRELRRAVELSPASAAAHDALAGWLSSEGRHREAVAEVRRALALDPLSPLVRSDVAWYLYFARRWGEAAAVARQTLQRDPGFEWAQEVLILSLVASGDSGEAAAAVRDQLSAPATSERAREGLASARLDVAEAIARGRPDRALDAFWAWRLVETTDEAGRRFVPVARFADLYMLQGRHAQALDALERAYELRSGWTLPFLRVHPLYDPLRGDPRFQALLERIDAHTGTMVGVIAPPDGGRPPAPAPGIASLG
jgi:TolB-like protein/DNA-binding winged helix-turn-helix (wHTH) protein/Tfp pilus assembly protein PilF